MYEEQEEEKEEVEEVKDKCNIHWVEAERNSNNKCVLNQIHQNFIKSELFKGTRVGPNIKCLATNFASLPEWIRSADTKYSDSDSAQDGCLAPCIYFGSSG